MRREVLVAACLAHTVVSEGGGSLALVAASGRCRGGGAVVDVVFALDAGGGEFGLLGELLAFGAYHAFGCAM